MDAAGYVLERGRRSPARVTIRHRHSRSTPAQRPSGNTPHGLAAVPGVRARPTAPVLSEKDCSLDAAPGMRNNKNIIRKIVPILLSELILCSVTKGLMKSELQDRVRFALKCTAKCLFIAEL